MPERFEIIIVFGTNRPLAVTDPELINDVKLRAMALFDIPVSEKDQYVLKAKDKSLPNNETVAQAKLHPAEKVTLSASAPYGNS